jgi:hypothetical protein
VGTTIHLSGLSSIVDLLLFYTKSHANLLVTTNLVLAE